MHYMYFGYFNRRFSIACLKTKTNVITLTYHKRPKNIRNQSELEADTCNRCQARENVCEQVTVGFLLLLIGRKSGASFSKPMGDHRKTNANENYFQHAIENRMGSTNLHNLQSTAWLIDPPLCTHFRRCRDDEIHCCLSPVRLIGGNTF